MTVYEYLTEMLPFDFTLEKTKLLLGEQMIRVCLPKITIEVSIIGEASYFTLWVLPEKKHYHTETLSFRELLGLIVEIEKTRL